MPAESLAQLKELSQFVDETANIRPNPRLPWVGAAAFSHKGGTHVNAVQKVIRSYEHIDPALVGNARHVLISDLAGRSNIVMKARELGFDVTNETPRAARRCWRASRSSSTRATSSRRPTDRWRCSSAGRSTDEPPPFIVDAYHVSMRRDGDGVGVRGDGQGAGRRRIARTRVADGDGPVNALDAALRAALVRFYRAARDGPADRLQGPHHRLDERHRGDDARAHRVERRHAEWGTVGVNDNIVEASLQALVDSLEYALVEGHAGRVGRRPSPGVQ